MEEDGGQVIVVENIPSVPILGTEVATGLLLERRVSLRWKIENYNPCVYVAKIKHP